MPKLTLFADPMCSWCYGFSPAMHKLRHLLSGKFELHLVMGGLRAAQAPLTSQERQDIQNHWLHVEQATGQEFTFQHALPDGFIYNTLPACKAVAVLWRVQPDLAWQYLDALHTAFYLRGLDITDEGNLIDIAVEQGLPAASFSAAIQSEDAEMALQQDLNTTADNGVNGFPSLLLELDDYRRLIVVGYEPYESVVEKITMAIQRQPADR